MLLIDIQINEYDEDHNSWGSDLRNYVSVTGNPRLYKWKQNRKK